MGPLRVMVGQQRSDRVESPSRWVHCATAAVATSSGQVTAGSQPTPPWERRGAWSLPPTGMASMVAMGSCSNSLPQPSRKCQETP